MRPVKRTRAPVIEHVKTSLAGAFARPKRKAKAKYDAQAVQDLIREADGQAYTSTGNLSSCFFFILGGGLIFLCSYSFWRRSNYFFKQLKGYSF